MNQKLFPLFVFILIGFGITAQPITTNSFEQKIKAAQEAEAAYNYAGALDWYEQAYDDLRESGTRGNPQVKEFALKIAKLSYEIRNYEKTEKTLNRILKNDEEHMFAEHRFLYAQSLKAQSKYQLAIDEYNKFISLSENEELIKAAEFELDGIRLVEGLEPNIETSFKALGKKVNSASGEFSPRENAADGNLYYGSYNRKDKIEVDNEEDDFHAKIYMAKADEEGKFDEVEELDQNINRKGFHNANVAFSRDGRTMYFTRVQTTGTEITSSEIMVSYKKDTGWSAADQVPTLNGDWHSKNPAVGQLYGKEVISLALICLEEKVAWISIMLIST